MTTKIIASLIIAFAVLLGVLSLWQDTLIVDEIPHVGAGYSYIAKGDFRLNPEHPPLAKDLAGLALKFVGLHDARAFKSDFWNKDLNGQWNFGRLLIFGSGNDADFLIKVAKIPMLLLFVLSALIIFVWTRKLYGNRGALIALFLFALSPTVIAHSRFVTTDVAALFGVLLSSYFFVKFLEKQNNKNLWLAGLAFGIAQLCKFSLFLFVPFLVSLGLIYAVISGKYKIILQTILIIAIGYIFIVWPVYYLHTMNYPAERQKADTTTYLATYGNRLFADPIVWLSDKPILRALGHYGTGVLMVTQRTVGGNTTYFLGETRNWGWRSYFPIVYFIKEPLPFWGFVIIALIIATIRFKNPRKWKISLALMSKWIKTHFVPLMMALWIVVYWVTSIRANLNIGVRHLMPAYGFTYILIAGQIAWLIKKIKSKDNLVSFYCLILVLCAWYFYENASVFPYYLTYFNQVAGGPKNGHIYVVDSNLDWGQDLKRLNDWVNDNNIDKLEFDYFGWSDPNYYLRDKYEWLSSTKYTGLRDYLRYNPKGGYLAVSGSFFMGTRGDNVKVNYSWLDNIDPIVVIGNSIFVWQIVPTR